MQIKDRVVVISGAASGMGAATAEHLAKQGAHIALLDINREGIDAVAKSCGGLAVTCDVTDEASVQGAIDQAVQRWGSVHANVNCAGICPAARVSGRDGAHDLALFQKVIAINLVGSFNVMRLCAAQMTKQDPVNEDGERGVLINTASVAAYDGQIGQAAYSASKGAIVSMTLPIARELGKFGVRVMTIAPGIVNTPMMSGLPEDVQKTLGASVPFPSRLARPEEYADLVEHIITNCYLNGSVIRLDGSLRMAAK